MDRSDLIKALGAAFTEDNQKDSGIKVESAIAGEKEVLRVSQAKGNTPLFDLQMTHPDIYAVNDVIDRLDKTGEKSAMDAAMTLRVKLENAAKNKNHEKIDEMIDIARDITKKLMSTSPTSQQRAIVYMLAADKIRQL